MEARNILEINRSHRGPLLRVAHSQQYRLLDVSPPLNTSTIGADSQAKRFVHPNVESLYSSGYTPDLGFVQDPTSESEIDLDCPCMFTLLVSPSLRIFKKTRR